MTTKELQNEISDLRAQLETEPATETPLQRLAKLEEAVAEYDHLFNLRWKQEMEYIHLWRNETGKELEWPSYGETLAWLAAKAQLNIALPTNDEEELELAELRGNSNYIVAPWSDDVIEGLNRYQVSGVCHPYTCGSGNRKDVRHSDNEGVLQATRNGWVCPFCDYKQKYALANSVLSHEQLQSFFNTAGLQVGKERKKWTS